MKVILDFDDDVLAEMQLYAEITQEKLNVMLSNLFIKSILEPTNIIRQEQIKDDCLELDFFHEMLHNFITNLAYNPNNKTFQDILIRIRDEHITQLSTMIDLYKVYKNL